MGGAGEGGVEVRDDSDGSRTSSKRVRVAFRPAILPLPLRCSLWQSENLLSEREESIAAQEAGAADEQVKLAELRRSIEGEKRRVEEMKEEAQQALDKAAAAQAVSVAVVRAREGEGMM